VPINKIVVSSEWTQGERAQVAELIQTEISRLEKEEGETRKKVSWQAPYFAYNEAERKRLTELKVFVQKAISKFLEMNRRSFNDFIQ
jgi:hypothetical protein